MTTATKPPVKPATPAKKIEYPTPVFGGERQPSILPAQAQNVCLITGFRGTGKSTFAATSDDPRNICFLDYESKGQGLHEQLGFGYYESIPDTVAAECGRLVPIEMFARTWQILEAIPKDRFTVLVLDNIGMLQTGMEAEVKDKPARYGVDQQKALTGQYGGAWPGVKLIFSTITSFARSKGIQLIVVISHLKGAWGEGKPLLGKFKTDGVDRIHELSTLSLVMLPGLTPPTPSALVMKEQMGEVKFQDGEFTVKRKLPLKLPKATWKEIKRYLAEGCDFTNPKAGEVPTPDELDPFKPTFSREQLDAITRAAAAGLLDQQED